MDVVATVIGLWLAKRQAEGGADQVAPPVTGLPWRLLPPLR